MDLLLCRFVLSLVVAQGAGCPSPEPRSAGISWWCWVMRGLAVVWCCMMISAMLRGASLCLELAKTTKANTASVCISRISPARRGMRRWKQGPCVLHSCVDGRGPNSWFVLLLFVIFLVRCWRGWGGLREQKRTSRVCLDFILAETKKIVGGCPEVKGRQKKCSEKDDEKLLE